LEQRHDQYVLGVWRRDSAVEYRVGLMSGSNTNMSLVTEVARGVDGTDQDLLAYDWTCPEVEPYSAIYFYQVNIYISIVDNTEQLLYLVHQ
jgi:hypothetical protein